MSEGHPRGVGTVDRLPTYCARGEFGARTRFRLAKAIGKGRFPG
jgi:hypothetical protein